jgi:hypothetical protein
MSEQPHDTAAVRWQRVKEVFSQALKRDPAAREAFLDEVCGTGDTGVRREVEALLAAHQESDTFLETPVVAASPFPKHVGPVLPASSVRYSLGSAGCRLSSRRRTTKAPAGPATAWLACVRKCSGSADHHSSASPTPASESITRRTS